MPGWCSIPHLKQIQLFHALPPHPVSLDPRGHQFQAVWWQVTGGQSQHLAQVRHIHLCSGLAHAVSQLKRDKQQLPGQTQLKINMNLTTRCTNLFGNFQMFACEVQSLLMVAHGRVRVAQAPACSSCWHKNFSQWQNLSLHKNSKCTTLVCCYWHVPSLHIPELTMRLQESGNNFKVIS